MALEFDKLWRAAEFQRSSPRMRWNELTREVELPLSDSAIAAAGSNRPIATALAMIAAYEALPELLDTIERLRAELGGGS